MKELKRMDTEVHLQEIALHMRTLEAAVASNQTAADRPFLLSPSPHELSRDAMSPPAAASLPPAFDVSKCVSFLPPFRETEVDGYFQAFERIAMTLQWPRVVWSLLFQCRLSGKALQVISALSLMDSSNYECVKAAVLNAYELVPEAYRQRFHSEKPRPNQTYVEYAHEKSVLFEKWCSASGVDSLADLKELIMVEEVKRHVPERLVLYLNEQNVSTLSAAALLADEFVLTHRSWESRADPGRRRRPSDTSSDPSDLPECFYCHEKGHFIRDCFHLQRKNWRNGKPPPPKPVAAWAVVPNRLEKCDTPHSSFNPFLSVGVVSLLGSHINQEVVILRDTGAAQTLIKRSVLPFSITSRAGSGSSVLLRGIDMGSVPAEVHHIHLTCLLISGDLKVAISEELSIQGVDLILGNDAVGGLVLPPPELISPPEICVLTCAQLNKNSEISLGDSVFPLLADDITRPGPAVKTPDLASRGPRVDLSVSRKSLVDVQKTDLSLASCFSRGELLCCGSTSDQNVESSHTFLMDPGMSNCFCVSVKPHWLCSCFGCSKSHPTFQAGRRCQPRRCWSCPHPGG
uniref:CCHC-type domain-containing protein n=1 Tax=Nothobranchius furzeri TaxID=105023 RepID=A0A8C6LE57_NOTFU